MSIRQDTPKPTSPTALTHLLSVLNQATRPGITFDAFLTDWLQALKTTWPDIMRAAVYLQTDSQLRLHTALGMSDAIGSSPQQTSVAARAAAQQKTIAPAADNSTASWGIPLDINAEIPGALVVDLPASSPATREIGTTLETLRGMLELGISHLHDSSTQTGTRAIKPTLTALYQIARQLSIHPATTETLNTVCRSLTLTPGVIYTAIFSFDQATATQTLITDHPAQLSAVQSEATTAVDALVDYVRSNPTPSLVRSREDMARILENYYARIEPLAL